jgi:hypothetical protein
MSGVKNGQAARTRLRHDTFEGCRRAALPVEARREAYLIIHAVPCEQFAFQETKPPRSPLGPI